MVIIMNSLDSIKRHVKLMVFLQKYGEGYGEELASIIKSEYKYYLRNLIHVVEEEVIYISKRIGGQNNGRDQGNPERASQQGD